MFHAVLTEQERKQGRNRALSLASEEEFGTRSGDIAIETMFALVASIFMFQELVFRARLLSQTLS